MKRKQHRYEDYEDYEDYRRRREEESPSVPDAVSAANEEYAIGYQEGFEQAMRELREEEEWEEDDVEPARRGSGRDRGIGAERRTEPARHERASKKERKAEPARHDRTSKKERKAEPARKERGGRGRGDAQEGTEKKRHPLRRFLLLVLLVLILAAAPVIYLIASRYGNIRQVEDETAFHEAIDANISEEAAASAKGYTNIALFGVDSREEELLSGNNRSDIIMILSLNDLTGDCRLVSVYRDTYLDISDGGGESSFSKCNAAYAYGGPERAVAMLNRNLDLNIRDFVTIGFGGLADVIDAVGGVEIDVQEDEIHGINDYQSTMAQELGRTAVNVEQPGMQTLNGLQAVAYCRIRYTSGDDFRRTQRQREVLTQTIAKAKRMDPAALNKITTQVFSEVATSMSMTDAMLLLTKLVRIDMKDQTGFPGEELRALATVDEQACIIPQTLSANVTWLHSYLFGNDGYVPSATVQDISARIAERTGFY